MKYTTTFKKAVLRKVLPPENRSVHSVSKEMGVGEITIHRWISQIKDGTLNLEQDEENPSGQRNMTEKLNLLLEYQKIPQEENGEWLRKNGLHEEHLAIFQQEIKTLMANKSDDKDKEIKELKKQLAKKDKELKRKEAALAELAAIMTLKKSWAGWTTIRPRKFNYRIRPSNYSRFYR
ncbi:transposase [uncultured Treponema sp.]|uniref:transposase n=3 Tax=Treponema TaxID=157 RepID=UPI00260EAB86|nr:transposase [uncultured Treponema sp.]